MKSLCDTLSDLTSAIQAVSKAAEENFEAVGNMCGPRVTSDRITCSDLRVRRQRRRKPIESIPVEGGIHSLTRFVNTSGLSRYAARKCGPTSAKNNEMVASCLSRSKDVPLDVELSIDFGSGADPRDLLFEQLLGEALPHSKRWRRLYIQFVSNSEDGDAACRTAVGGLDVRQAFRSPDVPLLESHDIRNNKSTNSLYMSYKEFAHWHAPSLRRVTAVHYFPLLSPALRTSQPSTSRSYSTKLIFSDMLADLSRMRFLEGLHLS